MEPLWVTVQFLHGRGEFGIFDVPAALDEV